MEKETKVTADEILNKNIKIYGGQALSWDSSIKSMNEFAGLKCAPLIKELEELKQQADKMAEALEAANDWFCGNNFKQPERLIIESLTNYKQTKH